MQDVFTSSLNQVEVLDGAVVRASATTAATTTTTTPLHLQSKHNVLVSDAGSGITIAVIGVSIGVVVIGVVVAVLLWWFRGRFRRSHLFVRRISSSKQTKKARMRQIRVTPEASVQKRYSNKLKT